MGKRTKRKAGRKLSLNSGVLEFVILCFVSTYLFSSYCIYLFYQYYYIIFEHILIIMFIDFCYSKLMFNIFLGSFVYNDQNCCKIELGVCFVYILNSIIRRNTHFIQLRGNLY